MGLTFKNELGTTTNKKTGKIEVSSAYLKSDKTEEIVTYLLNNTIYKGIKFPI